MSESESNDDRKKRLKGLKDARDAKAAESGKQIKFRNYVPQSEELADAFVPSVGAQPSSHAAPSSDGQGAPDADEEPAKPKEVIAYATALEDLRREEGGEDGLSVVPKDPTWDLKRDLEPKLALLTRKTQRVVVDIIRERLAATADAEE
ncbi:mRNA splicing factor [Pelagophyceae sp. CCMP2097]|nr:mRNA splicing factor [Pelagophyceae sp. CCMP2097]